MNKLQLTTENASEILGELKDSFFDIPFDSSKFQVERFVLSAEVTPERIYRSIGLKLLTSIKSLEDAILSRKEAQIDIEEIDYNISIGKLSSFDVRRQEIKKQKILLGMEWGDKLINDVIVELNIVYEHYKKFPKFTRAEFEAGEQRYYEQKLNRQLMGVEGSVGAVINMNEDFKALEAFEEQSFKSLNQEGGLEKLLEFTKNMPNLIKYGKENK
jgi:hypothetical protein